MRGRRCGCAEPSRQGSPPSRPCDLGKVLFRQQAFPRNAAPIPASATPLTSLIQIHNKRLPCATHTHMLRNAGQAARGRESRGVRVDARGRVEWADADNKLRAGVEIRVWNAAHSGRTGLPKVSLRSNPQVGFCCIRAPWTPSGGGRVSQPAPSHLTRARSCSVASAVTKNLLY